MEGIKVYKICGDVPWKAMPERKNSKFRDYNIKMGLIDLYYNDTR